MKIKVEIIGQSDEDKDTIFYSFASFHNVNLMFFNTLPVLFCI